MILCIKGDFIFENYLKVENCRIWFDEQPMALQELPMQSKKCTVCCGLWAAEIFGPYFFKAAAGRYATVNSARYHSMISNFLLFEMQE